MTLPLPHLTQTLSFESDIETDSFLSSHDSAIYTNASPPQEKNAWKPIKTMPPVPLSHTVWDCRKAHAGIQKGMEKYRVVDLKGQVD